jgi:hypothetical protein
MTYNENKQKMKTQEKNFTMISDKLCRVPIKIITQTEKLYIAFIIRYQANGNILYASNNTIGEQLGIEGCSVKKLNNKMNKQFNFFSAIQNKKYQNGVEYSSSHTIKIDEKLLDKYIDNLSNFVKEKSPAEINLIKEENKENQENMNYINLKATEPKIHADEWVNEIKKEILKEQFPIEEEIEIEEKNEIGEGVSWLEEVVYDTTQLPIEDLLSFAKQTIESEYKLKNIIEMINTGDITTKADIMFIENMYK